jgi:GT2 family glycosyltransferase
VLAQQPPVERVALVDCGSTDAAWLKRYEHLPGVRTIAVKNLGFAGGNNLGARELAPPDTGFVFFLNPDILLPVNLIAQLVALLAEPRGQMCAAVSPRLQGYDFAVDQPTGRIDSTGIFPAWWGAWRDRREGSPPEGDVLEHVPALCGACFLVRVAALRAAALRAGEVFDPRYFAYKEDIELSMRLRRAGWRLGLWHGTIAWHGRGWAADRRHMPHALRLLSARNEMRLHATYAPQRLPFSILKWFYVRWIER